MITRRLFGQLLRFGLVGATAALIYYVLLEFFYRLLSLPLNVAVPLSYATAVATHFFLNRSFTFHARTTQTQNQAWKYLATILVNLGVFNVAVAWVLAYWPNAVEYASVGGIVAASVISFILSKFWVFKRDAHGNSKC